ncbi:MAG: phage holin family protein [Pseudolabrys sp.]|jgi:type VI protein secretion system component VasK
MLASLLDTVFKLIKLDLKARLRAMTVSAVLTVVGVALLLTALGFGLALLYVWLQQMLGTIVALAIVAGACALLALILFAIAAWRPKSGDKPVKRTASPPPRPESATGGSATDRLLEEAVGAMQQGSREQMLAALSLALVTGIILGRKA